MCLWKIWISFSEKVITISAPDIQYLIKMFFFSQGGENRTRYASSGSLFDWFRRIFTKDDGTRRVSAERESYAPLRGDHDEDEDEMQNVEEHEGEEYEMIKRKSSHDSER